MPLPRERGSRYPWADDAPIAVKRIRAYHPGVAEPRLARDDFLAFLETHPAAVRVVLDALAKTIRRLSDRVEDLIFLDVPSRVAKYLLDLAQQDGSDKLELTLTQDELAAFIGASRVSVNRVLGDLERRDIIEIRRRHIVVRDRDRLAKEIRL